MPKWPQTEAQLSLGSLATCSLGNWSPNAPSLSSFQRLFALGSVLDVSQQVGHQPCTDAPPPPPPHLSRRFIVLAGHL